MGGCSSTFKSTQSETRNSKQIRMIKKGNVPDSAVQINVFDFLESGIYLIVYVGFSASSSFGF